MASTMNKQDSINYTILLYYKFVQINNPEEIRDEQKKICTELDLQGRILVAPEGINGTVEGSKEACDSYREYMSTHELFSDMPFKESAGIGNAFNKLKVKAREEVVSLGTGALDQSKTAKELTADELQSWYENNEDFVVLDLRNTYEIVSGKFDKTIDPGLDNFRELPDKIDDLKKELAGKKVVTVCTGGIRCEKATCLMNEGFENLYQLKDGIHTYMEKYPGQHFKGTLFVFDNRMTTDVVPIENKEITGNCEYCATPTEDYANDDSIKPSRKFLCCHDCFESHKEELHIRSAVA